MAQVTEQAGIALVRAGKGRQGQARAGIGCGEGRHRIGRGQARAGIALGECRVRAGKGTRGRASHSIRAPRYRLATSSSKCN
eukprot:350910-Chlamydomonas_euryale.AAC.2